MICSGPMRRRMARKPKPKTGAALQGAEADEDVLRALEGLHAKGYKIATQHLTSYLHRLEREHGFKQAEIGAALLIAAYGALRGYPRATTRRVFEERFRFLLNLTTRMLEARRPPSLH